MLRILFSFALFTFSLDAVAVNFIDNPNFDCQSPQDGWARCRKSSGCFYQYEEKYNDDKIIDQCFSMSAGPGEWGEVAYEMKNVPVDCALYFYVEASYSHFGHSENFEVWVELKENGEVLSRKKMTIVGHDRWHVIASDYPIYKKHDDGGLILTIWFRSNSGSDFQLNYAQVGSDPLALPARGARLRD